MQEEAGFLFHDALTLIKWMDPPGSLEILSEQCIHPKDKKESTKPLNYSSHKASFLKQNILVVNVGMNFPWIPLLLLHFPPGSATLSHVLYPN